MKVIFRYRVPKPDDGHLSVQLTADATILVFTERWHTESGWETILDVLEDTREPKVARSFFLCNAGDPLDFLGEYPDAYFVGRHESKAYASFLFETTHLTPEERAKGKVQPERHRRGKPTLDDSLGT